MPTMITAWLAALGAGFLTLIVTAGFAGPMFSFLFAFGAGVYVYKHFEGKHKTELDALQNPPSQVWPMSMPDAWTCMLDVLKTARVESGVSGVSSWTLKQEDNTRGIIQAQINFQQSLGSPTQPQIVSRVVTLNAQLTPEESNTRVDIKYEIFSPQGTGLVESVMKKTQELMTQRVQISKGE